MLNDKEKENFVKIINDYVSIKGYISHEYNSLLVLLHDHVRMLKKAREFYPNMQLTPRTYDSFVIQHEKLSAIECAIQKPWTIEYVFDPLLVEEIEKPIEVFLDPYIIEKTGIRGFGETYHIRAAKERELFYPKILKTSEEYEEEGSNMVNCVGGYIDTTTSIIISLEHGGERVTAKFSVINRGCLQGKILPQHRFSRLLS